ncbi:MAG: tetratricopeptide repeat protein [Candidatus Hydrogenedentes bacterium]|nr:tetratricopeptide repeat protein [Candidatus Hydrogenedentota bacterium]
MTARLSGTPSVTIRIMTIIFTGACIMGEVFASEFQTEVPKYETGSMIEKQLAAIQKLLVDGQYAIALRDVEYALREHPKNWNLLYFAGFACRGLDKYQQAIDFYTQSLEFTVRDEDRASVLQNRGVAFQLLEKYDLAVVDLNESVKLRPTHVSTRNSLGLTLNKMKRFSESRVAYEAALEYIAYHIVADFRNSLDSKIIPFEETKGEKWTELAIRAAVWICAEDDIETLLWPSGESAARELETREHGGQYWYDGKAENVQARTFLPNYFHTFREELRSDFMYANVLSNLGVTLDYAGETEAAIACFREAMEFTPLGVDFPNPRIALENIANRN